MKIVKVFNVRLTEPFYTALFRLAASEGCSMTVIVRRLIRDEAIKLGIWRKAEDA